MDLNNQPPTLCPKQLSKLKKKAHEENIWSCAYGQSEKDGSEYIITGSLDNNVKVWKWNVDRLEYIRTCEGHRLGVISVDINKSGTLAASSSLDAQIIIWDLESSQQMRSFDGAANLDAWTLMFSPDSRFIATGCQEGDINLIGVDSGKIERTISLKGKFCLSIAYSPLGTHLAAGALNGMINICDIQTGQLKSQDGHAMPVRGLAFSHDGQRLVSASDDGQIKVYDVALYGAIVQPLNFSSYFLAIFMINLLLYFFIYVILKIIYCESIYYLSILYVLIAMVCWGFALYCFIKHPTDWEQSPALSRMDNQMCMWYNFYDIHDIWHFLSSLSMFFSFMALLNIDDGLFFIERDKIIVF